MVANTTTAARSVEISISCLVNGYHHCPFKVKEGEVVSFFTKQVEADLVSPLWPHQVDISE